MSRLPQFNYSPTASPVDKFIRPLAGGPDLASANQLSQVASALSSLAPEVGQIVDRRYEAFVRENIKNAGATIAQLRVKNMDDLKAAADRGEIQHWDNPYIQEALQGEAAKVAVREQRGSLWDQYRSNGDLRNSNDPALVDQFVYDFYKPIITQGTPQVARAALEEVEQQRRELVQFHDTARRVETQKEMELTTRNNLVASMQKIDFGSPQEAQQLAGLQASINEQVRSGVPETDVAEWASQAAAEVAMTLEDPEKARKVLSSLTLPKLGSLSKQAGFETMMTRLSNQVDAEQSRRMSREIEKERYEDFKAQKAVSDSMLTVWSKTKDWSQVMTDPDVLAKATTRGASGYLQALNTVANAQNVELSMLKAGDQKLVKTAMDKFLAGAKASNFDKGKLLELRDTLSREVGSVPEVAAVFEAAETVMAATGTAKVSTISRDDLAGLFEKDARGQLTPADVAAHAPQLSDQDYRMFMDRAAEQKFGQTKESYGSAVAVGEAQIQTVAYGSVRDEQGGFSSDFSPLSGPGSLAQQTAAEATLEYRKRFASWWNSEGKLTTPDQVQKFSSDLVESVLKDRNLPTPAEFRSQLDKKLAEAQTASTQTKADPGAENKTYQPDQVDTAKLIVRSLGDPTFTNQADLKARFTSVIAPLNLTTDAANAVYKLLYDKTVANQPTPEKLPFKVPAGASPDDIVKAIEAYAKKLYPNAEKDSNLSFSQIKYGRQDFNDPELGLIKELKRKANIK